MGAEIKKVGQPFEHFGPEVGLFNFKNETLGSVKIAYSAFRVVDVLDLESVEGHESSHPGKLLPPSIQRKENKE